MAHGLGFETFSERVGGIAIGGALPAHLSLDDCAGGLSNDAPRLFEMARGFENFSRGKAGEILREVGYPDEVITKVQMLNLKRNFPRDLECRVLEDALCLVFLERQLTPLIRKSTEEKVINALQKSWAKMTGQARAEALKLNYTPEERVLIEKALNDSAP